jgi:hypothetical protein
MKKWGTGKNRNKYTRTKLKSTDGMCMYSEESEWSVSEEIYVDILNEQLKGT